MKYSIIPVTAFVQNCSLLVCEQTNCAALVDPGGEIDKLLAAVTESGARLEKIFLTHAHLDHAGAARELQQRLSIPIEGPHRDDDFWIQAMPQQAKMFGLPHAEPFAPDRWLEDGDEVRFGNICMDVVHCPGHTPGHVVFIQSQEQLALVGDVLFSGSIGRTDFPRGNHQQLIDSIREGLLPLGDDIRFIPGHGPMSTFGEERRSNPYLIAG